MMIKMYCIFSRESLKLMKGIRGKMASQAGHAFLHSYWDSEITFPEYAKLYKNSDHAVKITCVVETTEELLNLVDNYQDICGVTEVVDSGFTVFEKPTNTCVGIGPIPEELIGEDLKSLKLLT